MRKVVLQSGRLYLNRESLSCRGQLVQERVDLKTLIEIAPIHLPYVRRNSLGEWVEFHVTLQVERNRATKVHVYVQC